LLEGIVGWLTLKLTPAPGSFTPTYGRASPQRDFAIDRQVQSSNAPFAEEDRNRTTESDIG
jgi:hypothetical protein